MAMVFTLASDSSITVTFAKEPDIGTEYEYSPGLDIVEKLTGRREFYGVKEPIRIIAFRQLIAREEERADLDRWYRYVVDGPRLPFHIALPGTHREPLQSGALISGATIKAGRPSTALSSSAGSTSSRTLTTIQIATLLRVRCVTSIPRTLAPILSLP